MGGDQLAHQPGLQQVIDPHALFVGIVLDHGQFPLALPYQLADQGKGGAGHAEAAQHHRGPIRDRGDGRFHRGGFVGQGGHPFTGRCISRAIAARLSVSLSMISPICASLTISGGATRK